MTDGTPGTPPTDPGTLRSLAAGRALARDLADDLLTHVPDLGDVRTQRLLDTWVEQAADTLRALSEALEERLLDLGRPGDAVHAPGASGASVGHSRGGSR